MNLVLIGMPGCGKSTVGVLAAKALGLRFVDSDIVLQERIGMLLHDYIRAHGIEAFLDREGECLTWLAAKRSVIATGGSAVLRPDAMKALSRDALTVYLRLPLETIERRLTNITTRGIAMEPGQSIGDLFALRAPYYERCANITIDCDGQSVEETVAELVRRIREFSCSELQSHMDHKKVPDSP